MAAPTVTSDLVGPRRLLVSASAVLALLLLGGCAEPASSEASPAPDPASSPASGSTPEAAPAPRMPDLIGLPEMEVLPLLGGIRDTIRDEGWSSVTVRCEARPGTVVHQKPAPGTPLERPVAVEIRTAAIDLREFRGPCEPKDGDRGPLRGADAALARQFYRFAADPSLGAPFADGEVWAGIEDGAFAQTQLGAPELADLAAWRIGTSYAERSGPFSALDTTAQSGGYYRLRRGVPKTCPSTLNTGAPAELAGLRAISLIAPRDTMSSCMQWWAVTLVLDDADKIRGVGLRLGSP